MSDYNKIVIDVATVLSCCEMPIYDIKCNKHANIGKELYESFNDELKKEKENFHR